MTLAAHSTASSLSKSQAAKLAQEIEANKPIAEWDSVPELKKWREEVVYKNGDKKKLTFDEMVCEYKKLSAEVEYRQRIMKDIKVAVEAGLLVSGEDALSCEGYKIQRIEKQGQKKVDEYKLLEHGVSAKVIAECTVIGKSSSYVDIRRMKED